MPTSCGPPKPALNGRPSARAPTCSQLRNDGLLARLTGGRWCHRLLQATLRCAGAARTTAAAVSAPVHLLRASAVCGRACDGGGGFLCGVRRSRSCFACCGRPAPCKQANKAGGPASQSPGAPSPADGELLSVSGTGSASCPGLSMHTCKHLGSATTTGPMLCSVRRAASSVSCDVLEPHVPRGSSLKYMPSSSTELQQRQGSRGCVGAASISPALRGRALCGGSWRPRGAHPALSCTCGNGCTKGCVKRLPIGELLGDVGTLTRSEGHPSCRGGPPSMFGESRESQS